MSPAEVARSLRLRLAAELVGDRQTLERLLQDVRAFATALNDPSAERARIHALAFAIERWYTAAETILERSLKTVDGHVPSGQGWHHELLRASAVPIDGGRPALLSAELFAELREVLKFRHFARHGYSEELEWGKVDEHAKRALRAHGALQQTLDGFDAWLRA